MLSVFLLLAFTCLGHECQDLFESAMECMCTQTRPGFILSSERVLGKWSQNPCYLQVKSPLPEKFSSEEDWTHDAAAGRTVSQHATSEPHILLIVTHDLYRALPGKLVAYAYLQAYKCTTHSRLYKHMLFPTHISIMCIIVWRKFLERLLLVVVLKRKVFKWDAKAAREQEHLTQKGRVFQGCGL